MSELEDKINSVLNSPEEMSKIMELAKSFMGDESEPSGGGGNEADMPDLGMMASIGKLLNGSGGGKNDKRALLNAMTPYLSEGRRAKMTKAMQIARIAGIAGTFLSEKGGDGDI